MQNELEDASARIEALRQRVREAEAARTKAQAAADAAARAAAALSKQRDSALEALSEAERSRQSASNEHGVASSQLQRAHSVVAALRSERAALKVGVVRERGE